MLLGHLLWPFGAFSNPHIAPYVFLTLRLPCTISYVTIWKIQTRVHTIIKCINIVHYYILVLRRLLEKQMYKSSFLCH